MTNKPMLRVERDVIESALECLERCQEQAFQSCECEMCLECGKMPDGCSGTECAKTCQCSTCEHCCNEQAMKELRAILDKPVAQNQVVPVVCVELVENKIHGGMHIVKWGNLGKLKEGIHKLYAEQPAPVADHPQCEECKGWGYHENHHEGGGTECGECGGSGNATVAVAVVMPEKKSVPEPEDYNTNIDEVAFAEGYNDALDDVARLNGVKP